MADSGALYSTDIEVGENIPRPTGWRVLVVIPKVEEKTKGGIIRPEVVRSLEEHASIVGYVLALGPTAYRDQERFPTGPWCKKGDYILMSAYAGVRFGVNGIDYRLINDDTVMAVVDRPLGIVRK